LILYSSEYNATNSKNSENLDFLKKNVYIQDVSALSGLNSYEKKGYQNDDLYPAGHATLIIENYKEEEIIYTQMDDSNRIKHISEGISYTFNSKIRHDDYEMDGGLGCLMLYTSGTTGQPKGVLHSREV
jgi:acyl-coenzyme A synthetase/AMP-(fatty) acid ligase